MDQHPNPTYNLKNLFLSQKLGIYRILIQALIERCKINKMKITIHLKNIIGLNLVYLIQRTEMLFQVLIGQTELKYNNRF